MIVDWIGWNGVISGWRLEHLDSKRSSTVTLAAVLATRLPTNHILGDPDHGGIDDQVLIVEELEEASLTCRPWQWSLRSTRPPSSRIPRCSGLSESSPCIDIDRFNRKAFYKWVDPTNIKSLLSNIKVHHQKICTTRWRTWECPRCCRPSRWIPSRTPRLALQWSPLRYRADMQGCTPFHFVCTIELMLLEVLLTERSTGSFNLSKAMSCWVVVES